MDFRTHFLVSCAGAPLQMCTETGVDILPVLFCRALDTMFGSIFISPPPPRNSIGYFFRPHLLFSIVFFHWTSFLVLLKEKKTFVSDLSDFHPSSPSSPWERVDCGVSSNVSTVGEKYPPQTDTLCLLYLGEGVVVSYSVCPIGHSHCVRSGLMLLPITLSIQVQHCSRSPCWSRSPHRSHTPPCSLVLRSIPIIFSLSFSQAFKKPVFHRIDPTWFPEKVP